MTGNINVILDLQSCTDPLQVLPGSASESFPTSSDGACNFSNVKVEENVDVKEEGFTAINKVSYIGIKQEEIPEDTIFPDINNEPDEVSYVCVCCQTHFANVQKCQLFLCHQYFWPFQTAPLLGMKMFCCNVFLTC
jgi:hypothetical protein